MPEEAVRQRFLPAQRLADLCSAVFEPEAAEKCRANNMTAFANFIFGQIPSVSGRRSSRSNLPSSRVVMRANWLPANARASPSMKNCALRTARHSLSQSLWSSKPLASR